MYKTHKTDENGAMLEPVPIRNITVGTGTVVHNLSKLCQLSLEHLTANEHLPRMDKSTKAVLQRFVFMNENRDPLPISKVLAQHRPGWGPGKCQTARPAAPHTPGVIS